jgi:hypothetical protein
VRGVISDGHPYREQFPPSFPTKRLLSLISVPDFPQFRSGLRRHLMMVILSVFDLATSLLWGSVETSDKRRDAEMVYWPGWLRS